MFDRDEHGERMVGLLESVRRTSAVKTVNENSLYFHVITLIQVLKCMRSQLFEAKTNNSCDRDQCYTINFGLYQCNNSVYTETNILDILCNFT